MSFLSRVPAYLFSPSPFRRKTSTGSNSSTQSASSGESAASVPLETHNSYIRCSRCSADLCLTSQIISKGFTGRHGRAYLVSGFQDSNDSCGTSTGPASRSSYLTNTITLKAVPRQLVTGAHTVCDVSCAFCRTVLGWKYVAAKEESQRYKVGKFILETRRVTTAVCWEGEKAYPEQLPPSSLDEEERIDFDSQDEDECEDLFAGTWDPALVAKRRVSRRLGQARQ